MCAGCNGPVCLSLNSSFLRKAFYTYIIPLSVNVIHLHSEGELTSNWTERRAAHPFVFGKCPLKSLQAKSSCESCPGSFLLPSSSTDGRRSSIAAWSQEFPAYMSKSKWTPSPPSRDGEPDYKGMVIPCDSSPQLSPAAFPAGGWLLCEPVVSLWLAEPSLDVFISLSEVTTSWSNKHSILICTMCQFFFYSFYHYLWPFCNVHLDMVIWWSSYSKSSLQDFVYV